MSNISTVILPWNKINTSVYVRLYCMPDSVLWHLMYMIFVNAYHSPAR